MIRGALTRRRVVVGVVVLLLVAIGYTAWLLYAAQRDLRAAESDARVLKEALEAGDVDAATRALDQLQDSASAADSRTNGIWWSVLTITPGVGDDLEGVRGVSASLHTLAVGAGQPMIGMDDDVDQLVVSGAVDLDRLDSLASRVSAVDGSVDQALGEVSALDSSGYVGPLRDRFDSYVADVTSISDQLDAVRRATDVAPAMLGADGPQDFLLVFQNNAEVRASGGITGAWARVHTDGGRIELEEQGSAGDFAVPRTPLVELTDEERAVYSDVVGRYFANPVMIPDFPRAAELYDAFWKANYPGTELDGVVTLDTVALSYLLRATDPVTVDGAQLRPDNVVRTLLNLVYLNIPDPAQQDAFFTKATGAIFTAATSGTTSPTELVKAARQAIDERRLMVASFDEDVATRLSGTMVEGDFGGDSGATPQVDVTLDDATGAKMSYYLDYSGDLTSTSCADGVQQLAGSFDLRQTISEADARGLPRYLTGGGQFGVAPGTQQVQLRLYAPYGGTLDAVTLDGVELPRFTQAEIDGRQVLTVPLVTDGTAPLHLEWTMTSGEGQTDDPLLRGTPKVSGGAARLTVPSSC